MNVSLPHDDKLVAVFKVHPVQNLARTKEEGRPIYDDMEVVEIRAPGSRNTSVHPALMVSHKACEQYGTEEIPVTYAERFSHQYRQFKQMQVQTKTGTPLTEVSFITEARKAELRALNVYTAEQLAAVDGIELKNLGTGGRDLKNLAIKYIEESKLLAPKIAAQAELDELRARNAILEEDMKLLKAMQQEPDNEFSGMTLDQLRELITARTGHAPHGSLNRKTLERMAREAKADA